ncbi:PepSY domain-containing protein [Alloalcanivorax xenomutans]|jgi:uncharacterized membrane protein YkoI|uniref:PepSY domain-containing protein n=1 Tax=Alloalcanivorax xenomutans TaxID=1094342 RepID=A0A9Q3W867_9GAMM|nr:PepSY domain-containing protein [Alloalcanivorax xenomutans]ERS13722.1 peptidase [Alcanivorax sp. PN-3]KYZ87218.1 peptidase [Alcanivorax sp. KX64203]MBA4721945.1 PepSY domain-containing protein [Alcanivorax sp.]MCE7510918.1 PepSY domain-containing protein [Alloalcanivorax xenomutans]MCE7525911.1 PepSY domain-containing protein [Alloalcanivorax xenomutans]
MSLPLRGAATAALLVLSGSLPALDVGHDEALRLRQEGRIRPFEQILTEALRQYPGGQLLEAELEREDGHLIYEIELLTPDGVVRELELDARTGSVLKDDVDD